MTHRVWCQPEDKEDKAQEQFDFIKKLFLNPATTEIICATDAGREGPHIFDLIYQLAGSTKPVQHLWISSLTPEEIRAGFRNLKSMSAFANLSAAAAWREEFRQVAVRHNSRILVQKNA